MSQCVPNWDLSEPPPSALRPSFHPSSAAHGGAPMLEYEMAELTWKNGQLAMHGLGQPKVSGKIQNGGGGGDGGGGSKYTWDNKPARASGTLESLVNQGTRHTDRKIIGFNVSTGGGGDDLAPWFADQQTLQTTAGSAATTMDAMVPCHGYTAAAGGASKASVTESSDIPVAAPVEEDEDCRIIHRKRARVGARVGHAERKWSGCRNQISASGSATTFSRESGQKVTLDTRESASVIVGSGGGGFTVTTATSEGSLDKTSSGKPCIKTTTTTEDDHDSVCHSTHQVEEEYEGDRKKVNPKSSVSTKRSRAAAIHNQSERKRRDKINEKMKTLQKLVPNANKTDKASMLDEVIEYLKQLQAQVQMMNRMNMPTMMLPMAMQQPLPMASPMAMQQQLQQQLPMASLMAPMGMGMGMGMAGMGLDHLNMLGSRPGLVAGMSPLLHPTAFMTCDQLQQPSPTPMIADPFSTFLACQSQPMTMEAYNRMAMMFQQLHQHPPMAGGSKN